MTSAQKSSAETIFTFPVCPRQQASCLEMGEREREREIWRRGGGGNTDDKEGEEEEAEEEGRRKRSGRRKGYLKQSCFKTNAAKKAQERDEDGDSGRT